MTLISDRPQLPGHHIPSFIPSDTSRGMEVQAPKKGTAGGEAVPRARATTVAASWLPRYTWHKVLANLLTCGDNML